jgi:uncharacterized protein (TIGR00299 family) protein
MKIAYFDCSSGVSGDMCLGALVDAGVPLKAIARELKRLDIRGYRLEAKKVRRSGIAATKVDVVVGKRGVGIGRSGTKTWKDVRDIINGSSIPSHIKQRGLGIFRKLFDAEGKVHGTTYNRTHLHELGAVDCFVDVFGTLIGLDFLSIDRVYSSPVNLGRGSIKTEHGRLPVPAPATAEILRGVPVYSSDIPFELTTPTGAALIMELARDFAALPLMRIERVCYGAGQKEVTGFPNVVRVFFGQAISYDDRGRHEKVTVIETNIDDMNPQVYEYVSELLFKAGALDAYLSQVIMKKGRPGVVLTILCDEEKKANIMDIVFRETTTIGVRSYEASRVVLERRIREVETAFGKAKTKISKTADGTVKSFPEYEDCKKIARRYKMPLLEVMAIASKIKPKTW